MNLRSLKAKERSRRIVLIIMMMNAHRSLFRRKKNYLQVFIAKFSGKYVERLGILIAKNSWHRNCS